MKIKGFKNCRICGHPFQQMTSLHVCCTSLCASRYAQQKREAKEKKDWSQEKKVIKDKLKTRTDYEKDLQKLVNKIARLIDRGAPCVSSLKPITGKCDGGHRFSTGSFPALRFNLFNIHAQSVSENQYKSGNPDGYDHGLSTMYGDEYVSMVHGLKKKYPVLKLTQDELKEAIKIARLIVAELLIDSGPVPAGQRIIIRSMYNKRLLIYN